MAPKKQPRNGFMIFVKEWQDNQPGNVNIRRATTEAGRIWERMSPQERAPYNERAKQEKLGQRAKAEKLTCMGVPISIVDKEREEQKQREIQMKRDIETTVRNSAERFELDTQSYFFIMVNYFTKTLRGGVYVPAEISVAEYSLKEGVSRKYHTFVNPGVNIYGHQYEAQHHAETTHQLPLPPNAMGETNLGSIYNDVLSFVRNKETGEYPPLYTHCDSIPIVESVLEFLKTDMGANNVNLKIYSLQYLFFILKEATCKIGEVEKPQSHYITDAFFERDFFEYESRIACAFHSQFHEKRDNCKYCTQSCVTRWGFMFSDYMCRDMAIALKPGRHVPESTNLAAIVNPAPSACGDTESQISMATENSYATKALSEHKVYYDDQGTFETAEANSTRASSGRANSTTASFRQMNSTGAAYRQANLTHASSGQANSTTASFRQTNSTGAMPRPRNSAGVSSRQIDSNVGSSNTNWNNDDFPALGSTSRKKPATSEKALEKATKASRKDYDTTYEEKSDDEADGLNPWSSRSRHVPPEPDTSHFDIDFTREDLSDNDGNSVVSYGRGRGRLNQSSNSNTTAGSGRGRFFRRLEQ